jgi:hypothetical protein
MTNHPLVTLCVLAKDSFCTSVRATIANKENDWHYFDTNPEAVADAG